MKFFEKKWELIYKNKRIPKIDVPAAGEINNKMNYFFIVTKLDKHFKLFIYDENLKIGFLKNKYEEYYCKDIKEAYYLLYKLYPEKSPRLGSVLEKLKKLPAQKCGISGNKKPVVNLNLQLA